MGCPDRDIVDPVLSGTTGSSATRREIDNSSDQGVAARSSACKRCGAQPLLSLHTFIKVKSRASVLSSLLLPLVIP
jgi:hypothetical protein